MFHPIKQVDVIHVHLNSILSFYSLIFSTNNIHLLSATWSKLHPNAYGLLQNVVSQIENLEQDSLCPFTLSIRYPSCTSRLIVSFVQYHFLSSKSWGMVWPKIKPQKPSQGIKLDRLCFQKWIVLTLRKVNNKRYCKMKHKIIKKCITIVLKWQQNACGWIKFGPLKCYDRVNS